MQTDLRVVKTRRAIREAFIQLVEEKGYKHVTVGAIADRACINRNTFYLHYLDKEDLVSGIVKDVIQSQQDRIRSSLQRLDAPDLQAVYAAFRDILQVIYEEVEFYRVLLTDENLRGTVHPLRFLLRQTIEQALPPDAAVSPLALEFASAGSFGVIEQWIIYDTASVEETAKTLARLLPLCLHSA